MTRAAEDPEADFYETVVCELRQPLTTVNGGVQLARRLLDTDPTAARAALDQVATQIARLNMMLVELRDRARDTAHVEAFFRK